MQQPITSIRTRAYRRRRLTTAILARHSVKPDTKPLLNPIRVVCVSDTHNNQPELPPGDILIHAGDLTENGSFDEVQAGITWLSSQSHKHKILIAGNHDVLLDEDFLQKYPERRYGSSKTKHDLDWGSVIHLQDSSITLTIPAPQPTSTSDQASTRKITIYGSPWTPQYGISAFQYRPDTAPTHWSDRLEQLPLDPENTIIVTHGPPKPYLDRRDIHQAGCPYLWHEITRIRPRLHVFGHIHASHGREDVVLDKVRQAHDEVMIGWRGWGGIAWMVVLVVWATVKGVVGGLFHFGRVGETATTAFVNASVVGGRGNEVRNGAVVVEI